MGDDELLQAAAQARGRSHSPYSRFAVGAALLDEQGRLHTGANIENAAYPEGLCAEAVALAHLVMAGGRQVRAVAVVAGGAQPVTPCGGCRQKLREFASADAVVLSGGVDDGKADGAAAVLRGRFTLAALLPESFGPAHLEAGPGDAGAA